MSNHAETEAFLQSLPRLSSDSVLEFACHPQITCFNRCCGDLNLALSPYDVLRLRLALEIDSKTFLQKYGILSVLPGNQFPSMMLRMMNNATHTCPFVRKEGCEVYPHRPGACRVYPLGRGASIDENGKLHEEYLLVQEPHCEGFSPDTSTTVSAYLAAQGMAPYIAFDNRYVQLMHRWSREGEPLPKALFAKVFVALYRPDTLDDTSPPDTPSDTARHCDPLAQEEALLTQAFHRLETSLF